MTPIVDDGPEIRAQIERLAREEKLAADLAYEVARGAISRDYAEQHFAKITAEKAPGTTLAELTTDEVRQIARNTGHWNVNAEWG